ncbi:hypothetical protein DDF62_14675 [Caulobacter radicis]|nr:hypothetical protein DDF62_14675 [Caulobacter radicis]
MKSHPHQGPQGADAMLGSQNLASEQALLRAIAKRLSNSDAELSTTEEASFAAFVGKWGYGGTDYTGFPAAPGGDVNGWNSLLRTNWFNGRFMTAEALRRQDAYFDYRARLDAHALMPGVAWGLGLTAEGINATDYHAEGPRQGGVSTETPITLHAGLAFDMIGRPLLVPTKFTFKLDQLIALQKAKPRRVVGAGAQFAPCVCLAPDAGGPTGGSQALRPGPYLLIIEAAEQPSGDAKVYGTVCGDGPPSTCQSDAWQGGFGLSLVRFPVDVPEDDTVRSPWDLRGVLSSYFFDVFEHSLIHRWDPPFATDDGFCQGTGPGRRDTAAVALAMVYLGEDGTALWIDPWIPRRGIVSTPAETAHRNTFGAPPRAAAWARIHQFQCMLADSLAVLPQNRDGHVLDYDLLRRGFRHIPPIGFLPIDPDYAARQVASQDPNTGNSALDKVLAAGGTKAGMVSGYIASALTQAKTYFRGTNVTTYGVVALHDDDILEDLSNVFDKDPVQLDRPPTLHPIIRQLVEMLNGDVGGKKSGNGLIDLITAFFTIGLDDLVNRRIEIVKLMVPLQGLVRKHPILGIVAEDAQDQAADWGAAASPLLAAMELAGIRQGRTGREMLPRHFVVYVKQRLVLLDVLFMLLEMFQFMIDMALQAYAPPEKELDPTTGVGGAPAAVAAPAQYMTTYSMRMAYKAQPQEKQVMADAILEHPDIQAIMSRALPLSVPDLAVAGRAETFQAQVDAQDKALTSTIRDPAQRRQAAVDRVADSYAAVYPGFQVVQMFAATRSADQTEALVQQIGQGAKTAEALAVAPAQTTEDAVLAEGTPVFANADAAQLYAKLRDATGEKTVQQLAPSVKSELTVGEVLSRSPEEATALLGGAQNYARFRTAYAAQAKRSVEVSQGLAVAAPAGVSDKLKTALTGAKGDLTKAVKAVRTEVGDNAAAKAYLDHASTVATMLGASKAASATRFFVKRG